MLHNHIQNSHSKPQLPWLPIPNFLTDGAEFSIYLQETEYLLVQMTKQKVLVQIDLWGYFIYWNSMEHKLVSTMDLMHIEDIEICTYSNELFQARNTNLLRLQISTEGIIMSGKSNFHELYCKDTLDNTSIVFLLVNDDITVLESWKDALLHLIFTHYATRIDLAPLELLWKQWTHLVLMYSSTLSGMEDGESLHDENITVSSCCLRAALGMEESSVVINKVQKLNSFPDEEIKLENFTFDCFFNLFLQSWPREDIKDLFYSHTNSKGYMNCQELNSFLHTSISYFTNPSFPTHSSRNFKTPEKHKTLRHIKYLHLERTQHNVMNMSPSKTSSIQKTKSQKLQLESNLKRSQSCYTAGETTVDQTQERIKNIEDEVFAVNSRNEFSSLTSSPMHQNKIDFEGNKGNYLPISITVKEFMEIVQRHETNQYAANKCLLTNEGFYRLLLSSTYRELCVRPNVPSYTLDQSTITSPTAVESCKISLDALQHPLAHYYIKSAYLVNENHNQSGNTDHVTETREVTYFNTKFQGEKDSSTAHNLTSRNILRTVRQALFCGIRALILDCHHLSRLVGTEANILNELIVVPTNKTKIPTCFTETTSQDSFNLMKSILHKNYPYALVKSVLQILSENVFLVSDYPFILILNLHGLSQEQQCRLANLLQEYLGQWMMVSPLPKYTNHLDRNINKSRNKSGSMTKKPIYTRHLPSLGTLKNKILLSIRLVRTSKSLSEDQSQEIISNTSQNITPNKKFLQNSEITAPLTVFVTNPEGEQKTASQDIGSTNSSSQISPPAMHKMNPEKLSNKMESPVMSPYTERRIPSCSVPKSYSLYTNPASDRNNTFPIQDGITYLHPRLARLVVLPTPDFPSDTCIALHNQYSLETKKPNIVKLGGNHYAESNVFQESELRRKSEESELELNHQKTSYPEETQEYDQGPDKKIDETGLLTSLFNVITTRKAQIKHEERKRKLLRRLVTEVYGDGSDQMSTAAHDKSVSSESRNRTSSSGKQDKMDYTAEKSTPKPYKGWFKKRICTSPPKQPETNVSSKDTFLTATVRYARRLSNASIQKFNRSFNSPTQNTPPPNTSMDCLTDDKHPQGSTARLSCDKKKRLSDIQGEKEQESHLLDDNLIKSGSLPVDKEVHKSMTKSKSKSKQTQNLQSSHKSRTQSRKSSDNNSYKRSPNSSCGHCSCSSGSRSEKSSPIHEISQKQIGQNKFGYFRDGLQKFRSKFASEKQKSFEKYATPSNLTSVSRSMSSWSESEVSMKSEDSLSSDTTSTVSSPTDETSLSSTTKSSQSVCNSLDSYTSSGDNKLNKLNGDSPVEPVVPKTFRMSLSNVRHSITSLTNALFHPDKSNKRKILQRQSTIKSHESYTYSPRDYWLDALRWFIGPKITNISSTDLMHLLSKKQMTKALARYNKERLTCVFLNETEKSWDYYQLFRSAGCQLIPYDLDVSVTICSVNKPVSVRQQFMKLNQTDRLRNNSALSENGYVLKPALLRIPTINRYHRQLISRNKYQKLFQKSEFNASDKKNQIQNYLRCACCYDPLDISSERELINKIPDGVTCLDWPFSSTTEKYSYLPWNYTIQLINFTKIHKFIGTNLSLLSGQDNPDVHTNQQHIQTPFKLPKRYRKAANATATHQRHASAGPAPLPGTGTNSVHNQTTFVKSKSCFPTSIKHQSHENIHSKNLDNDFQRQHQWSSLKRETVENITVDTEITAPLFKFSHLSTNASSRFCKVPGENDAVSYRLYPNNPTLLTNCKIMNNQHTLGNSKTLSTSSYALLSPMNDGGRMNMCSSFSSMPRSNSELMVESLSTRNVTFSRIHLPESIAIRLNTKICKKEHDAESKCIKITDNKEKVIASCMINTNSPLNKTLTGFQHFQLKPIDHPDRILPLETKCDTTGFNHLVFHQRLKATFGILVFCKVSMNTYVPKSLGDLIETLSKEYDSRSRGRYCRQQTENQQHNANRSKSYVQLKRQESFREKHTIKQPVVRSNSFTYKEYHKKLKKNVV